MSVEIDLQPLTNIADLESMWRALETRADESFFVSWTWIGSLLAAGDADYFAVSARAGNRLLALGLLGARKVKRHVIVRKRQLCLNESGNAALDRITIEHNGLLIDRDAPESLVETIFRKLRVSEPRWQELVLSGVPQRYLDAARRADLAIEIDRVSPTYQVDLHAMQQADRSHLDDISGNTRAQIRKAMRLAETHGPLRLEPAADAAVAAEYFEKLREWHEARWKGKGAFSNPLLLAFHRRLVANGFARDEVELLRASAGNEVFGYLYNFRYGKTLLNYQSGFRHFDDSRFKPGLLAHHLCIERARAEDYAVYDMLAGDARYKRSLARAAGELFWVRAQQPDGMLAAERLARRIKQRASIPRRQAAQK
jgi:CelD/BcsL family acetyltransferase involved in cellulose biosynthesis